MPKFSPSILDTMSSETEEVQKWRIMLLVLQILMPIPAIISIIFMQLEPATLLTLSLVSIIVLCYYWWIKYKYLKFKLAANDYRRSFLYDLWVTGSPQKEIIVKNLQNKANCINYLQKLLEISLYSELAYKKSRNFFVWILIACLITIIVLLFLLVAYGEGDIKITIGRVILSIVIVIFSSDILNIILQHSIVNERVHTISQRLLLLNGNTEVEIDELIKSVIQESARYIDIMSYAYEILPYHYHRYRKDLENYWNDLQKNWK